MSGSGLVGDYADTSYLRLRADGADGAAELAASGLAFGVLTDGEDRPLLLLTRDGPARLVLIDAGQPIDRIMDRAVVRAINDGAPALIVVRDGRIAGLLTAEAVSDYFAEHAPVRSGLLGDERLHGDPPASSLTLTCTCGTVNIVPFYAEGETRCSQGHLLTVAWD